MYLLDHLLDELVGGFEVLGVRAVQQAGQHLAKGKDTVGYYQAGGITRQQAGATGSCE